MQSYVDIMHSFCRACNLRLVFVDVSERMIMMTTIDICGGEAILHEWTSSEDDDPVFSECRRNAGNFIGASHEIVCKSFLEAFLADRTYLLATDAGAFEAARSLKAFAGGSLERLVMKLDLMEAR